MRQKHNIQPKLQGALSGHQLAEEMRAMAQILEKHGCICDAVLQDLTISADDNIKCDQGGGASKAHGVCLMSVWLSISLTAGACREFMGLGPFDKAPGKSALQGQHQKKSASKPGSI